MCVHVLYFVSVSVCVFVCEQMQTGHSTCNLTGGLTFVNPLLGVQRMMMWVVDPPRWFHFPWASSRSQIEKLLGYYRVKGWLTLNMMTIPSWHFHFLKRLTPHGSWGQRCLLIFCSNKFAFKTENLYCKYCMQCGLAVCTRNSLYFHIHCISEENSDKYGFPTHA